jgi:hypothetical protein
MCMRCVYYTAHTASIYNNNTASNEPYEPDVLC